MITLYGFGPAFNLPDPSPFVTKVELMLKLAELDYQRNDSTSNLQRAPKSKLPFIEDDGQIVADSYFITKHLHNKYQLDLDKSLTSEQRAMAQLISKSLEENLYWVIVHARWIEEDVWPTVKTQFFDVLPFPLSKIIAGIARRSTIKQIMGHGMGRHSNKEITDIAHTNWRSLSVLLGDKDYFFGKQISSLDVSAFAILSAFTLCELPAPLNQASREYANLVEFTHRIARLHFADEINIELFGA